MLSKLLTMFIFSLATSAGANDIGGLPRGTFLGTQMAPAPDGRPLVRSVFPGSTGSAVHLAKGDIVLAINDNRTGDVRSVIDALNVVKAGSAISVDVMRGSQTLRLTGQAVSRPLEQYPNAKVTYGSFAFKGGRIRDILAMPNGSADAPVVFLLPGFSCLTIEPPMPKAAYRVLAARLTAAGIGYYRAEKPGVGDSVGGPQCADVTFDTELDAFRTAYRHLTEDLHIQSDRVIMLGHSLGALEAPLLADERAPRGVAVYGAVLRNWADYYQEIGSFQPYLINGMDAGKTYADGELSRPVIEAFYIKKQSPSAIVREHPELTGTVEEVLDWDGKDRALGRNWHFVQALAGINLPAAWRDAKTNVLSLYGGADIVALFDTDQKMIADIANFERPGSGTYVEVPSADHGMMNVGSREAARRNAIAQRKDNLVFDEDVANSLIAWIRAIMAKPPLAS